MTWHLCWKEYREHRGIWLVMAALTALLLMGLATFLAPAGADWLRLDANTCEALAGAALAMAVTYGLVCGSMMLAGEREGKTLEFLDTLSGRRAPLWQAKALAGAAFTLVQALAVACLALPFCLDSTPAFMRTLALAPVLALDAYAWGLAASALARSGFGAAILGAAFLAVTWLVTGLMVWALPAGALPARAGMALAAVLLSYRVFCAPDRQRAPAAVRARRRAPASGVSRLRALLWLTWRQARLEAAIVLSTALLLGLLVKRVDSLLACVAVLLAGVVCGVAVFADEQEGGAYRFVGDQRLPVGRMWAVKTLCWFLVAVLASVVVVLGVGLTHLGRSEERGEMAATRILHEEILREGLSPLLVWGAILLIALVYGFAVGQLAGLFSRRRVPALVVAGAVAFALVLLWVPSLLLGGLPLWQLLGPPVLLLAAGRLVMWWWASDRLWALRPVACLVVCTLLVGLWMAGGLWYRVAQVPDVGAPFDRRAFEARVAEAALSEAGPLIREAARELDEHEKRVTEQLGPPKGRKAPPAEAPQAPGAPAVPNEDEPIMPEGAGDWRAYYYERLDEALEKGWPKGAEDVERWLDRMFEGKWAADFRQAASLPPGLVVDPRHVSLNTLAPYLQQCREAAALCTGRALQLQARGDPAAALDQLAVALELSRQVSHLTPLMHNLVGRAMEGMGLSGLESWLARLGPRAPLLRRAQTILKQQEEGRAPLAEAVKAEYYVLGNTLDKLFSPAGTLQSKLYAYARHVPWEKERERRLVDVAFGKALRRLSQPSWEGHKPEIHAPEFAQMRGLAIWMPLLSALMPPSAHFHDVEARDLCRLRAARLQVALALYRVENGKPATALEDLVPRYLDRLPIDPFSGKAFHYRVSRGERIEDWAETHEGEAQPRDVPAGQEILWSVGPDGKDDGARRQGGLSRVIDSGAWPERGMDIIFLVPQWPKR